MLSDRNSYDPIADTYITTAKLDTREGPIAAKMVVSYRRAVDLLDWTRLFRHQQ